MNRIGIWFAIVGIHEIDRPPRTRRCAVRRRLFVQLVVRKLRFAIVAFCKYRDESDARVAQRASGRDERFGFRGGVSIGLERPQQRRGHRLDRGDYFTATVAGSAPVTLSAESGDATEYTAELPLATAAEDITIAFVRGSGHVSAPDRWFIFPRRSRSRRPHRHHSSSAKPSRFTSSRRRPTVPAQISTSPEIASSTAAPTRMTSRSTHKATPF